MPFHVEPSDGNPVSDVHQDKETDHEGIQPPTVKEGRRERRHPQAQLAAGGQQAIRRQPPELPAAQAESAGTADTAIGFIPHQRRPERCVGGAVFKPRDKADNHPHKADHSDDSAKQSDDERADPIIRLANFRCHVPFLSVLKGFPPPQLQWLSSRAPSFSLSRYFSSKSSAIV